MPLDDDDPNKWDYPEHTRVKHEILRKYLDGWIKILGTTQGRICYFDCFAGRGEYSNGEEGSPIIAINLACELKRDNPKINEITFAFIEKNKSNFENLKNILETDQKNNSKKYSGITIILKNQPFDEVAEEVLDAVGTNLAPSLFFVDPFGFNGIPFKLMKQILQINKTEVFITFMIRDVNRFLESPQHGRSIEEMFGMPDVNNVISTTSPYKTMPREQALLKLYREQLHTAANVKYTLPFKVNSDEKLQTTYYLIHCTNHPKGCHLMKEIMYKAGTEGLFGYLGPAEGQMTLTQFNNFAELKIFLQNKFRGRTLTFQNVRYETLMETSSVQKQYREAIRQLDTEKKVTLVGKGPLGGIGEECQIVFPKKIPKSTLSDFY